MTDLACTFCKIAGGSLPAAIVHEDPEVIAFLDRSPLFHGHTLVVPRAHHVTLADVPPEALVPIFTCAQRVARAIEAALGAEGYFVAINNKVSQSVPHLHVHVVPRRKKDGLKGFFWPRQPYRSDEHMDEVAAAIRAALAA